MSEQTAPTTGTEETQNEQTDKVEESKEFQAITSQEDFDRAIQSRLARERAKFPDYDKFKADAEKLREVEEANKSEEQKRQERDAARDRELAELKAEKLRSTVAAEKSDPSKGITVPANLLTGSTREELEASADALIAFKGEAVTRQRVVVPREGDAPVNAGVNEADQAILTGLFGNKN